MSKPEGSKRLKGLEGAFLREKYFVATGVFWQCAIALLYFLSFAYFFGTQLHARKPELYTRLWPTFLVLGLVVFYLILDFLRQAQRITTLLKEATGQPRYNDLLISASALTRRFFHIVMGLGVAMSIALLILEL